MEEAGNAGILAYTQVLTATDASTVIEVGNSLNGIFQRTVTGTTNGTLIETGTDRGTPFEIPSVISTAYGITETGNLVSGALSLTESGADRYSLLEQFNNISNAVAANGPGNVDYSPTGAPFSIGQGPAAPTGGNSYPGQQSPAAEEQDPFAQQGLDLLHEYCFAGEAVIGDASGRSWPICASERERPLRSPNDSDGEGALLDTHIEQVYKNGIKPVMRVHFGGGMVRVTPNHPWYVKGGKWVSSARLKPGDLLRTDKETWVPVDRIEDLGEVAEVYNLRIAGTHTYFIGNGDGPFVLVHNESPQPGGYSGGGYNPLNWMRWLYTGDPNMPDEHWSTAAREGGGKAYTRRARGCGTKRCARLGTRQAPRGAWRPACPPLWKLSKAKICIAL